jgi:secreted trypsin-like serine protease
MRKVFALVAAAAVCAIGVGAAGAVTSGTPDGDAHPYVVLLRVNQLGGAPPMRCSGVLVKPTKIVTAAHCLENAASVDVWTTSGEVTTQPPDATSTTWAIEAGYVGLDVKSGTDTHDLAVITLATPLVVAGPRPTIAGEGATTGLPAKTTFTVVGYGVQSLHPVVVAPRTRLEAVSALKNPKDAYNLRLSENRGGACFGDSGGPVLIGDTVVAIVSFGQNEQCTSSYYAYRLDTAASRAFLAANGAL